MYHVTSKRNTAKKYKEKLPGIGEDAIGDPLLLEPPLRPNDKFRDKSAPSIPLLF